MQVEAGLENVVAAETALSHVDGAAGRLIVRGHDLETLIGTHGYEDVVALMFDGMFDDLPTGMQAALAAARQRVFAIAERHAEQAAGLAVFDGMRALTALLPDGTGIDAALDLVAGPAVFVPALTRLNAGQAPVPPNPDLTHAADILAMMGVVARTEQIAGLDRYLMTVADHGLNASTFAARVVASTGAGLTSAILAGLGALKGPLHGGAPGPVLDMLDAVGTPDNAARWIDAELKRGERLMGFGHRIYRVRDPRADALKTAVETIHTTTPGGNGRLDLARAVEQAALAALKRHKPDRPLQTNVEFYTALLLEAAGFDRDAFTAVFAMGRVTGWLAHAREQALTGRLIRPKSVYAGPAPQQAA